MLQICATRQGILFNPLKMFRDITDRHIYSAVHSFFRKNNKVLFDFASLSYWCKIIFVSVWMHMGLVYGTIVVNTFKYFMLLDVKL